MDKPKLFQIGDVAKLFHLSVSSLRHYENVGLLTPEYIAPGTGYRYYSPTQIPMLREICFLRSIGMPTTVGQLGITLDEQAIEKLAWMCTFEGRRTIGSFKVLGLEEIKDIYRAAR